MRRDWGRNVQHQQTFVQGRMSIGNAIEKQSRQNRQIQPGNHFMRKVRIELPDLTSS